MKVGIRNGLGTTAPIRMATSMTKEPRFSRRREAICSKITLQRYLNCPASAEEFLDQIQPRLVSAIHHCIRPSRSMDSGVFLRIRVALALGCFEHRSADSSVFTPTCRHRLFRRYSPVNTRYIISRLCLVHCRHSAGKYLPRAISAIATSSGVVRSS